MQNKKEVGEAIEQGFCPICGTELEYNRETECAEGVGYECTCPNCEAELTEYYSQKFEAFYSADGSGEFLAGDKIGPLPADEGDPSLFELAEIKKPHIGRIFPEIKPESTLEGLLRAAKNLIDEIEEWEVPQVDDAEELGPTTAVGMLRDEIERADAFVEGVAAGEYSRPEKLPLHFYCDECGEEVQMEACNHVRACAACQAKAIAEAIAEKTEPAARKE